MGCVQGKCFGGGEGDGGGDSAARVGLRQCCCEYQDSESDSSAAAAPAGAADPMDGTDPSYSRLRHVLAGASLGAAAVPSAGLLLQFSSLTQRGHYPDSPDRINQDSFCIQTGFQSDPDLHLFAVFDGHGVLGTQCSQFARDKLVERLAADPQLRDDPDAVFHDAFPAVNAALHESEIDDSMSGTTAIAVLVNGGVLVVANVGDSRAVAGVWDGDSVVAEDLSSDQKPFRRDEYERVRQSGARVLSVDQVEGNKNPDIQSWGEDDSDEGDPPRLWVQNGMYPGTAFTRSIGDATAESIGVIAEPEVKTVSITHNHLFFVVASDGIFEFLSSQAVVDMVYKYEDPRDACAAVAAESYKLWLEHEDRTDDITIIVVHIKDLPKSDVEDATHDSKDAFIALAKVKPGAYTMATLAGSVAHHQNLDSQTELLHSSHEDLSMERSTAHVAPSPTEQIDAANNPD